MFLPHELLQRAARWPELKRWERRELGQDLRRLGLSYREIGKIIPVPKGTLSGWCRDLPLTDEQEAELAARRPDMVHRREIGGKLRQRALERAAAIRRDAREEGRSLLHDPFWVAGVVAYWSEGSKRSKRLSFSNSDPALVLLFLRWAQRYLELADDDFVASLHLHSGQDEDERKGYWRHVLRLPDLRFRKTYIKREGTGHRKNTLYNGTLTLIARRSGELLHRVLGWIDALGDESFATLHSRAASSTGRASGS